MAGAMSGEICTGVSFVAALKHYPPPPPPLPAFRAKEALTFTYTGVDFAGLLYVKGSDNSKESKVWIICLFHLLCRENDTLRSCPRFNSTVIHMVL